MSLLRRASHLLLGFLLALAPSWLQARAESVRVEIVPAKVERRTFDPRNPPEEMPKLTPPEVGTCVYQFACSTEAQAEGLHSRRGTQGPRVTEIRFRATLTVTLWTPAKGPPKILAHEEGHREVCEYYYDQAESIARRLAQRAIGTTLAARNKAGMQAELDRLQKSIIREFLHETATRCDVAQAHFDAITQHSMDPIAEDVAIVRAVAAEEAAYAHDQHRSGAPSTIGAGSAAAAGRYPPTRPKS